jgi:hypothetical protein
MRVTFDLPEHQAGGVYPWAVDDVVSYLFLPISKKSGRFIAPYCVGIGTSDPNPMEEYIQTKMEQYYKGIREDIFKFLNEVNDPDFDKKVAC